MFRGDMCIQARTTSSLAALAVPVALLAVTIASCEEISYTPYDNEVPDEYRHLTARNLDRIANATRGRDEVRFAVVGDPQRELGPSGDFVDEINARDDVDFVVVAGDLTEYGVRREYQHVVEVYSRLDVPWLTVIGNHDKLGKGEALYGVVFGEFNYTLDVAGVRLVFFDSVGLHTEDGPVNFAWLAHQLRPESGDFAQAVVITHVPTASRWLAPSRETQEREEKRFTDIVTESGTVSLTIHGHWHRYEENALSDDVLSIVVDNPGDRNFLHVTLRGDAFETEQVFF